MSYVTIADSTIAYNSPITSRRFGYIRDNFDWLHSAINDGAGASQGINTSTVHAHTDITIGGDLIITGDFYGTNVLWDCATVHFPNKVYIWGWKPNATGTDFAPGTTQVPNFNWGHFLSSCVMRGIFITDRLHKKKDEGR